ncbi:MAG: CPBP family intramembrane metalloprotease [Bacillaceae bacterium]|nr:CPBP family intramembrane metalloprotease [Bacillaceae bacterium]
MNKSKFLIILLLAHCLISISFLASQYFWTLFPITMALLTYVAWNNWGFIKSLKQIITVKDVTLGMISGVILYTFFFFSFILVKFCFPFLLSYIDELYEVVGPTHAWHYLLLIFVVIPGEEIFWRGFVQNKLSIFLTSDWSKVMVASGLYGLAHIWTGNLMLIAAALTGGLFWGFLLYWKKNIGIVLLSHYTFNLFLLILFPLTF